MIGDRAGGGGGGSGAEESARLKRELERMRTSQGYARHRREREGLPIAKAERELRTMPSASYLGSA